LAWAAAATVVAGVLVARGTLAAGPEFIAICVNVAAAVFGALLTGLGGDAAGTVVVLAWAIAGGAACQLTGGTVGPCAVWCLTPLAAAVTFRRPTLLPLGAAAALAVGAVVALATILLAPPRPEAELSTWLSLLALGSVGLGFAAGLVAFQGRVRGQAARARDTESGLLGFLDQQPQLLMAIDAEGHILRTFGEAPPGIELRRRMRQELGDLVAVDDRPAVYEAMATALADGTGEAAFVPVHYASGWCVLALRRVGDGRLLGALRDGRPQRDRESALEDARVSAEQQNAGKSRFLANMSHELRTPLNAIMGFSDIMRQRLFGPMSDRYAEYAELIHESGSHLLELINDVLDMSKIEAERFELSREDFDAREAITAVLRLMRGQADRAGIQLRSALPSYPLEAEADRRAIKQIALNLLSNALKFTPKGGSVLLTAQARGGMLEIIVADTGVGISAADLVRLGRPFEQAGDADQRSGGAGLGLSLVRAFARLHGGEMVMDSVVGEGTTVTVRMPVLVEALLDSGRADIPANG
jgi:cell cycle sensor histidine kinase DivJ